MKIDLANIAGTPGARGRFAISERLSDTEEAEEGGGPVGPPRKEGRPSSWSAAPAGPVTGELTVENAGSLLLVRGHLHVTLRMPCVRCLKEGEQELEIEVEEEFASEGAGPEVRTIDRDEPELSAMTDFVLDAHEFARQQVVASVPMSFLCRPDCRGICPECGKDLNEGPCQCPTESGDHRWASLGELLRKTD